MPSPPAQLRGVGPASGLPTPPPGPSEPSVEPPAPGRVGGGRLPRWVGPAALGVAGLGACVLIQVRDPHVAGSYLMCPFLAATGMDCPGCGLMRGTNSLLRGDVAQALDHNIFVPLVLPLLLWAYIRWARRSIGHDVRPITTPSWYPLAATAFLAAFWIIRNLAGPFEYLDSGLSS